MATHNRTPVQLALGRLRLRHPALAASLKKVNKTSQGGVERCYDPEGSEVVCNYSAAACELSGNNGNN